MMVDDVDEITAFLNQTKDEEKGKKGGAREQKKITLPLFLMCFVKKKRTRGGTASLLRTRGRSYSPTSNFLRVRQRS
jgi:hypothetical protein